MFSQIKKMYSQEELIHPKNILVEYLQYELLDSIYKQKEAQNLSFMGGTSIRIIYQGNRFSEDLDFDNFGLSFKEFQVLMKTVSEDMLLKGFKVDYRLSHKDAFHCYFKFPGLLKQSGLSDMKDEKILLRIDMMKKENNFQANISRLNKFNIFRNILVNPVDIVLSQKLNTIITRKRKMGRDFYDFSFLYGQTEPNFAYIEENYFINKDDFMKKIINICEKLNFNELAKDVEPLLIYPEQKERVKDFLPFIKKELSKK
jgi:predicted nucleotidyltransferase component of viral defense system